MLQVHLRSRHVAYGIMAKGVRPGQFSVVGIFSSNRPEVSTTNN